MIAIKTLRIYLIAAALIAAAVIFYTKAIAPREPVDSDTVISFPDAPTVYTGQQEIFGTNVSQTAYGEGAPEAIQTVYERLYQTAAHWDTQDIESVPGRIAASAGLEPTLLEEEDYTLLRRAFDLAEQTEGLFDPTVGALAQIWREGEPAADRISWALTYTGWEQVQLSDAEKSVSIAHPGVLINLDAAVKGMAVEKALEIYQKADMDGALLSMDGAAVMTGQKGDGSGFTLGLLNPLVQDGGHYAILSVTDQVICTSDASSGLLDPFTGELVQSDLAAVTVVSEDGFLSDVMSSILYMQGMDAVRAHLNESDYSVIAVGENGDIVLSENLRKDFTLVDTKNFRLFD